MNRFNNVIFGQKAFIINDDKKILVLKRQNSEVYNDMWDIPGGKLEEGDSLLQAITREIKEETGLDLIKIISIISSSKFQGNANDKPLIFRNIYLVKANGEVKLSKEHSEFKWVEPSKLKEYQFGNDTDLQKVLAMLPELVKGVELDKASILLL